MADPIIVVCPADVWKLVTRSDLGESRAIIHVKDNKPGRYLHTFRSHVASPPDPLPATVDDGIPIYGPTAQLNTEDKVDLYIMAVGEDGKVRVDAS